MKNKSWSYRLMISINARVSIGAVDGSWIMMNFFLVIIFLFTQNIYCHNIKFNIHNLTRNCAFSLRWWINQKLDILFTKQGNTRSFSSKLNHGQCKEQGGPKLKKAHRDKIGLLLCHSHIELRLRLRLSWGWYWGWGWFEAKVLVRLSRSWVEVEVS